MIQGYLKEKKEAQQYYEQVKSDFQKGQPSDIKGIDQTVKELNSRMNKFKPEEQLYKQIQDLIKDLEKKKTTISTVEYAKNSFNIGDSYYHNYQYDLAAQQYEQGLKAIKEKGDIKDPLYAKYYKLWEESSAKGKRFKEILDYVAKVAVTTQSVDESTLTKSISLAEEGLKIVPNSSDLNIHLNKLKIKLSQLNTQKQKQTECETKWTDGVTLFNSGKTKDALNKFKENLVCNPNNKERQNYVSQLESKLMQQEQTEQQLKRLISEANVFEQQKKYKDAIQKYEQAYHIKAQPEIKERIALTSKLCKAAGRSATKN